MPAPHIIPSGEKFAMTQEYAAVISATLAALFLVGIVELTNSMKSRREDRDRIRSLHFSEIKESITALKKNKTLPAARLSEVQASLRLYKQRMDKMVLATGIHAMVMMTTILVLGVSLLEVLHWSALEQPTPSPEVAKRSYLSSLAAMLAITLMHWFRSLMTSRYLIWERRRELADEFGTGVDEAMDLVRRWVGQGNPRV
ncbi:hypothetical protein V7793_14910 [Streptomyces sp. KLMMK]|uniref:hypothetical protein n=1 Tax=Streptomyces sp. KLMMK TaxID=3109353 RepID=UPI0030090A3F